MATLLRLEKISKDFSGLKVLAEVSLKIAEGKRHAIIGPNGAGKSTLFNIITGLHKPSKGRLFSGRRRSRTGLPIKYPG